MTKSTLNGITELIAACGFQTTAPGVGPTSFTHALTHCLKAAYWAEKQFSVSELYSQVLSRLRNTPGRTTEITPVHCTPTSEKSGRQIMLAPISAPQFQAASPDHTPSIQNVMTVSFGVENAVADMESWRDWILKAPVDASHLILARRAVGPGLVIVRPSDEGYDSDEYYSSAC